jgi:single-strand DNA-binding protein
MARIDFIGNLGGEAKIEFTPSGNAKLSFSVADTKGKKDAQGNWDKDAEQTQWLRCTLWGPDAEYYAERLRKGSRVTVYGELMAREYVDRDGANRTSLDVTVRGLSVVNKPGTTPPTAQRQQAKQDDPWGTPAPSNAGGWGNGPSDNTPPW